MEYENMGESYILNCPICKNILITYSLSSIIGEALRIKLGIIKKNDLFKKWLNDYHDRHECCPFS